MTVKEDGTFQAFSARQIGVLLEKRHADYHEWTNGRGGATRYCYAYSLRWSPGAGAGDGFPWSQWCAVFGWASTEDV